MRSDYIDVKPEKIESRTSSRTSSSSQYRSTDRLDSKSNSKIDKDSRSRSTKSSSSSSSTIRKRKSSDRRSRDRSRSSSKRHRTSKSDISNDKTSKSEKKVKKNNGTTLPELPNIIKVVKNSQKLVEQSSNSSPVAEIQAEEELHTDNESDAETMTNNISNQKESETVPKPPELTTLKNDLIKVQKVTFGTLAAKAESSGFLPEYKPPPPPAIPDPPPQNRRNSEIPTDEDHTDNPTDNPTSGIDEDEEDDDIILTDDSLSELSDSELDKDPTHRMALEYYDKFSKGQLDWCEKFPELGPECRNCHRRENCNFPCDHPPKYQCKLCGQWNHQTFQCRDRAELEYKKNYNIPCVYCSKRNHLGRNCPDHWRQFHRTTGSTYIPYDNTPADRTKASCYNCAAKGHWGHECTAPRPTPLLGPILEPFTTGRVSDSQSDLLKDDKIRREKRNKKRFLITIG